MWPFKKKTSLQDNLNAAVLEAEDFVAEKWMVFRQLQFENDVSLETQIQIFMQPALESLVSAQPSIAFLPTELVMLVFANGIAKTKTHAALEIQNALGIPSSTT
jgi:hypothetical protein